MSTSELLQDWAWLIAVGLSAGFVLLLVMIKRIQARNAYRRAVAEAGEEQSSDSHFEFMQARRNFFLLIVVVVIFLGILTFLNLYYPRV